MSDNLNDPGRIVPLEPSNTPNGHYIQLSSGWVVRADKIVAACPGTMKSEESTDGARVGGPSIFVCGLDMDIIMSDAEFRFIWDLILPGGIYYRHWVMEAPGSKIPGPPRT